MKKSIAIILSILFIFSLTGCNPIKEVEKSEIAFSLNDNEIKGLYTGMLENGIPTGDAVFEYSIKDSNVVFNGTFEEGIPYSGEIENLPLIIKWKDEEIEGDYNGQVSSLLPDGKGVFTSLSTDFTYEGDFGDGLALGSGEATNLSTDFLLGDSKYNGTYSGVIKDYLPDGKGKFDYKNDKEYILYEGNMVGESPVGEGKIETSEMVITFTDGTVRKGEYIGDVLSGVPEGDNGSFTTVNDYGDKYKMEGAWKNGLMHGQGERTWLEIKEDDKSSFVPSLGNWTNGYYNPSVSELVKHLSQYSPKFNFSSDAETFISNHADIIISHETEGIGDLIDTSFSFPAFAKNPSAFQGKLMKESGLQVLQTYIWETYADYNVVFYLLIDSTFSNYYFVYVINDSTDIVKDDIVELCALPLDYSTFENTDGGETWCLPCVAVYIKK